MDEMFYKELRAQACARIVGCAFNTYNYWHWGVDELVYEAGMLVELGEAHFQVHRQEEFPIFYKGIPTPVKRRLDLVANESDIGYIIIELKALDYVGDVQRKQLWSYMRLTNIKLGMLINFGPNGVYTERWELDDDQSGCHRF